jgi:O-antigen/teichoic acid export membrane protein
VQATDAKHRYEFSDFVARRLLSSTAALLVVMVLLAGMQAERGLRGLSLVVVLGLAGDSFCDIFGGLQQKHERMDRLGISLLLRALLSVTAFAAVFWRSRSLLAAAATLPLVSVAVLTAWDVPMARRLLQDARMLAWRGSRLRELVWFSLPLGVIMMLVSLNVSIPRWALMRYAGRAEVGIFASLSYVVMVVSLVANGLGQSVTPRLARMFANGEVAGFRRLMVRLCGVGAAVGAAGVLGAALVGRWALTALYRPEYAAHNDVFLLLAATAAVGAVGALLGFAITAAHVFRFQMWTTLATVATTAAGAFLLVPRYHAMGAASALLISSLVNAATAAIILQRAMQRRAREFHVNSECAH